MKRTRILEVCSLAAMCFGSPALAADNGFKMTVQLVSPINSRTNHKGDRVTAIVSSPDTFRGDQLDGFIEEAKSSGDLKKTSSLRFVFKTLTHQGKPIAVTADITRFQNSKGQPGVDEEGRAVRKSSGVGKAVAAAAIGAGIGALLGGAKGAAIGAGAGLAVGFIFVSVAVKGPEIAFDPKSMFELSIRPCDRCAEREAVLDFQIFTNDAFSFNYPRNWQAYSDASSSRVSIAPPSGVIRHANGQVDIGYGAVAGIYVPDLAAAADLTAASNGLIRILQTDNPELQVVSAGKEVTSGDVHLYTAALSGNSALEAGRDIALLITWMRPEGLFYFIGLAPASRSADIRAFSLPILQSLNFH